MARFKVVTPSIRLFHDEVHDRAVFVEAEYFRIDAGALIFRNSPRRRDEYPQTVHVFAPGCWSEVHTATPADGTNVNDVPHHERRFAELDYERER